MVAPTSVDDNDSVQDVELPDAVPMPSTSQSPVLVEAGIYLDDFFGITDPHKNEFMVDFWLTLRWHDKRHENSSIWANELGDSVMIVAMDQSEDELWLPQVHFTNARSTQVLLSKITIYRDNSVIWARRMQGSFEANMKFDRYPFDKHTLQLKLECHDCSAKTMVLSPWWEMTGMKNEDKSSGAYIWDIEKKNRDEMSCSSSCEGQACMRSCEEEARYPAPFSLKQSLKSIYSGAPKDGSKLASSDDFKVYRITVGLRVERRLGSIKWGYFLPSGLLVLIAFFSFIAKVSDISTRFTISLVALLTFEVMYERVNRQLPAMETITWSSVYHVFNLLLLTGIVCENGLVAYSSVFVCRSLGTSIDAVARVLFSGCYITWIIIMCWDPLYDINHMVEISVVIPVALLVALCLWFRLRRSIMDRLVMRHFAGYSRLRKTCWPIGWEWYFIDHYIDFIDSRYMSSKPTRCLFKWFDYWFQIPGWGRQVLMEYAWERVARGAGFMEGPFDARLSARSFTKSFLKTGMGQCLVRSDEIVQHIAQVVKERRITFEVPRGQFDVSFEKKCESLLGGDALKEVGSDSLNDSPDSVSDEEMGVSRSLTGGGAIYIDKENSMKKVSSRKSWSRRLAGASASTVLPSDNVERKISQISQHATEGEVIQASLPMAGP